MRLRLSKDARQNAIRRALRVKRIATQQELAEPEDGHRIRRTQNIHDRNRDDPPPGAGVQL